MADENWMLPAGCGVTESLSAMEIVAFDGLPICAAGLLEKSSTVNVSVVSTSVSSIKGIEIKRSEPSPSAQRSSPDTNVKSAPGVAVPPLVA
jgi:hypothetical protein